MKMRRDIESGTRRGARAANPTAKPGDRPDFTVDANHARQGLILSLRQASCATCSLSGSCLPSVVGKQNLALIDSMVDRRRPLHRGALLFYEGMPFDFFYVVRSGAIKTCITLPSGQEQVTNFFLPGELVGLDSLGLPVYASTATALDTTAVCALPLGGVVDLAHALPPLQRYLLGILSGEIRLDHQIMQLIAQRSAEERVASFILNLAARYKLSHLPDQIIHLPMSRSEIGNFLGLVLETTSRVFGRLEHQGLIEVSGRELHILDEKRLDALANHQPD